ncbi:MAG: hypothetical protein Q7T19_01330 [Caulobacter sp.]|nr:hypothetical protein [Caulobacter sp.]
MDRRTFLASGALVPVAALAGGARAAPAGETFSVDGHLALNGCRALVEAHLGGVLAALKALALTSDARSGRWDRIKPALAELAGDLTTEAAVWFARPDGRYHTVEGGLSPESLGDRDYFPGLMAGRDVEGALVVSKSTGHRSIIVAAPVSRGGKVVGALGVSVRTRLVGALVEASLALPDDLVFYALDATGRTAIHKDPEKMFVFPSDLGNPGLAWAVTTMLANDAGSVDYDFEGRHRTALFVRSPATGWRFVLVRLHA